MGIIPLEKLIEYKGNRYELTKAMIELAKNGGTLLKGETRYRGGKYIPTVMKNILDGRIKYEYEENVNMTIDIDAPFKHSQTEYNETEYAIEEEETSNYEYAASDVDDSDDIYDDYEEDEKPRKKKRASKKKDE